MAAGWVTQIVESADEKEMIGRRILDSLPQWFGTEQAKQEYVRAARSTAMFACMADETVTGFLTLKIHNEFAAEIHLMGVLRPWHRRGAGTRLVRSATAYAKDKGLRFLTVKTLAPSRADENYRSTRRFYRAVGWGPDNPCLMMIKYLAD